LDQQTKMKFKKFFNFFGNKNKRFYTFNIKKPVSLKFVAMPLISLLSLGIFYKKFKASQLEEIRIHNDIVPIYRFVLTGGPNGGKTTAMSVISNRLMSMGFLVLIIPETTDLLKNGISLIIIIIIRWCSMG
jgi:hypothetical protein